MDYNKLKLFFNTLKYLKAKQVFFRFYYFFKRSILKNKYLKIIKSNYNPIVWHDVINNYPSFFVKDLTFVFLNISHSFCKEIDWNYQNHGKLWIYNLNYFEFLNQEKISRKEGVLLIKDFLKNKRNLKDANEQYPISLRCINWVKFLSKNKIHNKEIDCHLYNDFVFLSKNLEYHLLGNHLLENAFSLLFGAYYFQDKKLYHKSRTLLEKELEEQILKDGAHFELSPMYHQIILYRLLDCLNLIKFNRLWIVEDFKIYLEKKARLMLSWLKNITYQNGDIPMVNDSTYNIAPTSNQLFNFAKKLGIAYELQNFSISGYRKFKTKKYELFLDVGDICSDYQPGHSHSDIFNFELIKEGKPIFVDSGISTYEKNVIRQNERITCSHNTVQINNIEQTQVWGGFRVANRAKVKILSESNNQIQAIHDGYKKEGFFHKRTFKWQENKITLKDEINKSTNNKSKAFFHLHSSINLPTIKDNKVIFNDLALIISFVNLSDIDIKTYELSHGFNFKKPAYKIVVSFDTTLITKIQL